MKSECQVSFSNQESVLFKLRWGTQSTVTSVQTVILKVPLHTPGPSPTGAETPHARMEKRQAETHPKSL